MVTRNAAWLAVALVSCTPLPTTKAPPEPEAPKDREALACEGKPIVGPPKLAYESPTSLEGVVGSITIAGSERVDSAALREAILTAEGAALDRERLRDDVARIWGLGHFDDVAVHAESLGGNVHLTFRVHDSAQVVRTYVRGGDALAAMVRQSLDGVTLPTPFDPTWVLEIEDALRALYHQQGYRGVKVDSRFAPVADDGIDLCVRIDQGARSTIESITFEGNQAIADKDLALLIETQGGSINVVGGVYRELGWDNAALRMQARYYDDGYLDSRVEVDEPESSEDGAHLRVVVRISEGAQFRLASLSFDGPDSEAYPALMQVKAGDIFNRSKLVASLRAIEALHAQRGQRVRVEPLTTLDRSHNTVELVVRVVPF